MKQHNITFHTYLSLFKLLIGLFVMFLVGRYIDPFQDPETWVIIWSVGLMFFVWGLSYFIFYYASQYISDKKLHILSSQAYKASLLVALYILTNVVCIMIEFWSIYNGLLITALFVLLYWIVFFAPKSEKNANIDMIVEHKEEVVEK